MAFSPPADAKYIRIQGHAYPPTSKHPRGGAFNKDGSVSSNGYGYGKCECGTLSPKPFLAKSDRIRWHFSHRVELLNQLKSDFEEKEADGQRDSEQRQSG